ncbi:MAG: helix-turn-helix transcriptional regulator [Roseateles sp.]
MSTPSAQRQASRIAGLLGHLYDAAADPTLWRGTAARVAAALGSTSAVLKLHGGSSAVQLLECTDNLVVTEAEQAWAEDWHRRDLWVERSMALGPSRIVTSDELVTPVEQRRSAFYQDWLRRLDIHHMLGAVFPVADGAVGVLGVHRPQGAAAYAAAERRQAALLLPHLQRALRLGQQLAARARLQQAALAALDRLDTGVLMLDAACRALHVSARAATLLRDNPELVFASGRFGLASPSVQQRLLARVRAAVDLAGGQPRAASAALSVPRPQRMPLALEVLPLLPTMGVFGATAPACLVFIRDPQAPLAVARLRELFGLTPAEAAVAAALAQGCAPEAIATATGTGVATVRTHLKRLLAKTGTHRQAEVVALLARSLAAADPG